MAVTYELHQREAKSEQCWIFVNGELVEKCAAVDKADRLAAYGRTLVPLTKTAQVRGEQASRGKNNGYGFGNRYSGRRAA